VSTQYDTQHDAPEQVFETAGETREIRVACSRVSGWTIGIDAASREAVLFRTIDPDLVMPAYAVYTQRGRRGPWGTEVIGSQCGAAAGYPAASLAGWLGPEEWTEVAAALQVLRRDLEIAEHRRLAELLQQAIEERLAQRRGVGAAGQTRQRR